MASQSPVFVGITTPLSPSINASFHLRRSSSRPPRLQPLSSTPSLPSVVDTPGTLHSRHDSMRGSLAPHPFTSALSSATAQLRATSDATTLEPEGLEAVELLSRELEHFKQRVQRSQCGVEGVWDVLEREGGLPQMGREIYTNLMELNPSYAQYFSNTDMDEQSEIIIRMIGSLVGFASKPETVVALAQRLGARHRGYGVPEHTFPDLRTTFMTALARRVTPETFAASRAEWDRLWAVVLEHMSSGYRSELGERVERRGSLSRAETVRRLMRSIAERESTKERRQKSTFVAVMYAQALEEHPELGVKFVALRDLRVANRVFAAIVHIASRYHERDTLKSYMMELGARHSAYNVTDAEMRMFKGPFLDTCRAMLEEWSSTIAHAFEELFFFMVDGIIQGMTAGKTTGVNAYAPSGSDPFCLMFTDIENSTKLWQVNGAAMGEAVKQHHRMIRVLIAEYGAYEVKTVGDSFIIACKDMLTGAKIALGIQLELMRCAPIAEGFRMVEPCEGGGDPDAWDPRTLRVRIGMEYCTEATPTYDTIHRRYDYYGTSVNRCARVEAAACGGQILLSRQTFEALMAVPEFRSEPAAAAFRAVEIPSPTKACDGRSLSELVSITDMGKTHLKGLSEPVHLVSMLPLPLAGRRFTQKM